MSDARERVRAGVPGDTRDLDAPDGFGIGGGEFGYPWARSAWFQMPGHTPVLAEVVGFSADKAFLMPLATFMVCPVAPA